jgi:hypothetical protein
MPACPCLWTDCAAIAVMGLVLGSSLSGTRKGRGDGVGRRFDALEVQTKMVSGGRVDAADCHTAWRNLSCSSGKICQSRPT